MEYQRVITFSLLLIMGLFQVACNRYPEHKSYGYIEGRFTFVASQVSGKLEKIMVSRGSQVKKDAPLFHLDSSPEKQAYLEAVANLEKAKANLANLQKGRRPSEISTILAKKHKIKAELQFAKLQLERAKRLYPRGAIQKDQLDKAQSDYDSKKAELEENMYVLKTARLEARIDEINAAKAAVKSAFENAQQNLWALEQKKIKSPVTGLVFDTFYRKGEVIVKNKAVLSILAPENIKAIFYVPERVLASLTLGQVVKVYCDSCKKTIKATIRFISPEAEYTPPVIYSEKSRDKLMYRIEAHFSPQDAVLFHPGQPITISYKESNKK